MKPQVALAVLVAVAEITYCSRNDIHKSSEGDPIVEICDGRIRGETQCSRKGRTFYSFKSIPFAMPPVGELRFKAPEKPEPWSDILDAKSDPPPCIQKNYFTSADPEIEGTEDCLYLNVYTPLLPNINISSLEDSNSSEEGGYLYPKPHHRLQRSPLLPVMVYIHWGGLIAGSSSPEYLGPEYLMDKEVVLVTANYRLGALGFLSTGDDRAPGNWGLKDQVAVLQWVKDNIKSFSGDNGKVTVFGTSAGGASTHFHVLSPASRGLFHRAIAESGNALAPWAKPLPGTEILTATALAQFVGCENLTNSENIVDCLKQVPAQEILKGTDKFKFFSIDPVVVFLPAVEVKSALNPKPFLTTSPTELIKRREFNNVPFIMGVTEDEGILRAGGLLRQAETRTALNAKFDELMPDLLGLAITTTKEKIRDVWDKMKDFYFDGADYLNISNPRHIQGLIDIYSDRSFHYSAYQAMLLHSNYGHKDLWFYNFNYKGEFTYGDVFSLPMMDDVEYDWGVSHCDELLYLFKSPKLFVDLRNKNDLIMSKIMIKLWTTFATHGNPTPVERSGKDGVWLKVDTGRSLNKNFKYLNISGSSEQPNSISLTIEDSFNTERINFWEGLPLIDNIEELNQTPA